jgi:two-component system chemotaxis response regulator CheY
MSIRILVVDDDPMMCELLGLVLQRGDYQVIGVANDGADAIKLYDKLRPDMVLLDLMMPRVDGFVALREIMARHPDATVVVCSVLGGTPYAVEEVFSAGAREFVNKPFTPGQLRRALARVARAA